MMRGIHGVTAETVEHSASVVINFAVATVQNRRKRQTIINAAKLRHRVANVSRETFVGVAKHRPIDVAVFPQKICIAIKLEIIIGMIPRHGANVEKITGIFAQKVGDGDATHIIIYEKMVDARRCIVRQML